MSRRWKDSRHLANAAEHLRVLKEHLARGDLEDDLVRDAVSHRLEVAIDAVGKIDPDILEREGPDDWPKIVAMRNIIAHAYADVDPVILRNTIDNRLGDLVSLVEHLRAAVEKIENEDASGAAPPAD